MQYVDLGTLPPPKKSRLKKKRSVLKLTMLILASFFGFYILALIFWPGGNIIKEVLQAPINAIPVIGDPLKSLKSTDGRTNILVLGIDKRKDIPYSYKGPGGLTAYNGFLADTMLIASINLETKDIALISIPRDLWVDYGGSHGMGRQAGKINSVYSTGTMSQYPGGGVALAKETVEKWFGLPIHYGVRIDFEAFRRTVNTVGGVDINIAKSFEDYEYPIEGKENAVCGSRTVTTPEGSVESILDYSCRYEVLRFKAGPTHLDGETALKYVRSRHGTNGEGSDFARSARQQKILIALKNKALSFETLTDPIKIAKLIGDYGETVETDFELTAIPGLIKLANDFSDDKVRNVVINGDGNDLLINPPAANYGGAWVLVPRDPSWKEVREFVKATLFPPPPPLNEANSPTKTSP